MITHFLLHFRHSLATIQHPFAKSLLRRFPFAPAAFPPKAEKAKLPRRNDEGALLSLFMCHAQYSFAISVYRIAASAAATIPMTRRNGIRQQPQPPLLGGGGGGGPQRFPGRLMPGPPIPGPPIPGPPIPGLLPGPPIPGPPGPGPCPYIFCLLIRRRHRLLCVCILIPQLLRQHEEKFEQANPPSLKMLFLSFLLDSL